MKGWESASELETFWIREQASDRRALARQFGWAGMLIISMAKAQHSSPPRQRRRVLRASNPLGNRRLETHDNAEGGAGTSPLWPAQARGEGSPHTSRTPIVGVTNLVHHPQIPRRSQKKGAPTIMGYLAMCMKTKGGENGVLESLAMFMKTDELLLITRYVVENKSAYRHSGWPTGKEIIGTCLGSGWLTRPGRCG